MNVLIFNDLKRIARLHRYFNPFQKFVIQYKLRINVPGQTISIYFVNGRNWSSSFLRVKKNEGVNENRFRYFGVTDETTLVEKKIGRIGNENLETRHVLV